jgi:hypothetical protein
VNRTQAHQLAQQGAALRAEVHGIEISFRGQVFSVLVQTSADSLALATGGFDRDTTLRLRFPETYEPRPERGEAITVLDTGNSYRVTHSADLPWSPLAAEYIVEAERA